MIKETIICDACGATVSTSPDDLNISMTGILCSTIHNKYTFGKNGAPIHLCMDCSYKLIDSFKKIGIKKIYHKHIESRL